MDPAKKKCKRYLRLQAVVMETIKKANMTHAPSNAQTCDQSLGTSLITNDELSQCGQNHISKD